MIKTFEQFINENYNEVKTVILDEEYGAPLFNEVSESLMTEINNSINEGKLVIDVNMIEEGLFDTVGNLFKKGADKMSAKIEDTQEDMDIISDWTKGLLDDPSANMDEIKFQTNELEKIVKDKAVFEKIESLCKSAEEICAKLAEKEEAAYKTISEKMTAANEAIKEFTEKSIAKIKEIAEVSKNKVSDIIAAVLAFCKRMAEFAKKGLEAVANGVVLAFALPFVFAFSVYKGAMKVCEMLVEKVKDGAKIVKDVFTKVKTAVVNWVKTMLARVKEALKTACDAVKDGAKKAYNAIGKAYLAIVAVLGQLASDAKDAISEAYNDFVDGVKELADDVKTFVAEKWDVVSKWCKKTATAFADGVKNVWEKMKDKVTKTVDAVKDAYKTLKDNANATWDDIQEWSDEKRQAHFKDYLKYGIDTWGKDAVSSWIDEIK